MDCDGVRDMAGNKPGTSVVGLIDGDGVGMVNSNGVGMVNSIVVVQATAGIPVQDGECINDGTLF